MFIPVIPLHPLNAPSLICTIPLGNTISPVKLLQFLNAFCPIVFIPLFSAKSILKFVQFSNALFAITINFSGNSTSPKFIHPLNALSDMKLKSTGRTAVSNSVQFANASFPIFTILSGNSIPFKFVPLNASSAILITTNPFIFSGTSNTSNLVKSPSTYFNPLASLFSNV